MGALGQIISFSTKWRGHLIVNIQWLQGFPCSLFWSTAASALIHSVFHSVFTNYCVSGNVLSSRDMKVKQWPQITKILSLKKLHSCGKRQTINKTNKIWDMKYRKTEEGKKKKKPWKETGGVWARRWPSCWRRSQGRAPLEERLSLFPRYLPWLLKRTADLVLLWICASLVSCLKSDCFCSSSVEPQPWFWPHHPLPGPSDFLLGSLLLSLQTPSSPLLCQKMSSSL